MEETKEKIAELVRSSVDEVNEEMELADDARISNDTEAVLYGAGAAIDSMTLVSLIVAVEENVGRELGLPLTLANERAMSMTRSPFTTLASLIDYVVDAVEQARAG